MASPTATTSTKTYQELVEEDKKSILTKALGIDLTQFSRLIIKSDPINVKEKLESQTNPNSAEDKADYASIIKDAEIDDSEEIFDKALKEAEVAFEKDEQLKKKHPLLHSMMNDFAKKPPKPVRKRTKALEEGFQIMKRFKENLMRANATEKAITSVTTKSTKKNKLKSTCSRFPVEHSKLLGTYPKWKTTANYTPIFSEPENPNWTNLKTPPHTSPYTETMNLPKKKLSTISSKMYTPGHINSWLENVPPTMLIPPSSCKTIKSDAATCNSDDSEIDNESILSFPQNQFDSSTPLHSPIFYPKGIKSSSTDNAIDSSIPTCNLLVQSKEIKSSSSNAIDSSIPIHRLPAQPKEIKSSSTDNATNLSIPIRRFPAQLKEMKSSSTDNATNSSIPIRSILAQPKEMKSFSSNAIDSSIPMRSTIVRFKPSPPEHFLYNKVEEDSISSNSLFEETEHNELDKDVDNTYDSDSFDYGDAENYHYLEKKINAQNIYHSKYEHSEKYESCNEQYEQYSSHQQYYKHKQEHINYKNGSPNETCREVCYNSKSNPFFVEDFINKLKSNINHNYNMEFKCSMKVKYFK